MKLLRMLSFLVLILRFILNNAGKEYGISHLQKFKLAVRIVYNYAVIKSLTYPDQHILLAEEVLRVPISLEGDVVECGCYNGASTISLSLACALTKRKLIVCDSFEGLPKPKADERYDIHAYSTDYFIWEEREFSSVGGLEGVKENIEKFGNIEVCQFVKGYFSNTLKEIDSYSIVLIFEDADLRSSVEDCIRYLWPKLEEGCKFYCHEPWSINVVSLFYDKQWWEENLNTHPPGFYGSGQGIRDCKGIGYAKKFEMSTIKEHGKKIIHEGSRGFKRSKGCGLLVRMARYRFWTV
jgi:O-methyltransferase